MPKTSWMAPALPFVLLSLLTAAACGDDDDTGATVDLRADWNAHCDAFAACPVATDAASCKASFSCMETAMRADMLAKTVACQSARTCDSGGDDACYSLEAQGLAPSAAAASYQSDCLAKRDTCTGTGTSFSDDYCYSPTILKDPTIATLADCLSGECATIAACADAAINAAAPGCS
jgi:hypothetical protein